MPHVYKLYLLILTVILACAHDNRMDLSDLRFPDPERLNSKRNQVDTTFLYYARTDGTEDMYYQTFDEEGRIVCDSTQPYVSTTFYYNHIGLLARRVITRSRSTFVDSLTYRFDQDSLILEQSWPSSNIRYKFYFNDDGRLLQSLRFDESGNENGTQVERNFYYSSSGMLDSCTLQTDSGHRQKWIYDNLGLPMEEWSNNKKGGQRFIHKMRQ